MHKPGPIFQKCVDTQIISHKEVTFVEQPPYRKLLFWGSWLVFFYVSDSSSKDKYYREFSGCPVVRTLVFSLPRAGVQFLVQEIISHTPHSGAKKKKKKRTSIIGSVFVLLFFLTGNKAYTVSVLLSFSAL